ncbi:MAG: hypothetical protein HYY32_02515 [Chloroflexi bacterium]|nr:hypothetical protein [Chloroflexota bacterium]
MQTVVLTNRSRPGVFRFMRRALDCALGALLALGLMSTPLLLESGKDTLAQVFDPVSLSRIEIAYGWNGSQWVEATASYKLAPLSALYVKVAAGGVATATLAPSTAISQPPSRSLTAGANLVGPAPALQGGASAACPPARPS